MSTLRKLELIGGFAAAAIGVFVAVSYIRLDQQAAERTGREFTAFSTILIFLLLDAFPGLLVFLGAYVHSIRRKRAGQFLLITGSVLSLGAFVSFLLAPYIFYGRGDLFGLMLFSAVSALLTSVVSLFVQRQSSQRTSSHLR